MGALHGGLMGYSGKLSLPFRTYVWKGGTWSADLKKKDGSPDPRAGKAWCFVFGEKEWMAGKTWREIKKNAQGDALHPGVGRILCN